MATISNDNDVFGIPMLYESKGTYEWDSQYWNNNLGRYLIQPFYRPDENDPQNLLTPRGGNGQIYINGDGSAECSGSSRMYWTELNTPNGNWELEDPRSTLNYIFKNTEITTYFTWDGTDADANSGCVFGVRTRPEGHAHDFSGIANTYYARVRNNGRIDFEKEVDHNGRGYGVIGSRDYFNNGLPENQTIGYKYCCYNIENNSKVKLEIWLDEVSGGDPSNFNRNNWVKVFEIIDDGIMTNVNENAPANPFNTPPDTIFTQSWGSCLARTSGGTIVHKYTSIREIMVDSPDDDRTPLQVLNGGGGNPPEEPDLFVRIEPNGSTWIGGGGANVIVENRGSEDVTGWEAFITFNNRDITLHMGETPTTQSFLMSHEEFFTDGYEYGWTSNSTWTSTIPSGGEVSSFVAYTGDVSQISNFTQGKNGSNSGGGTTPTGKKMIVYFEEWAYHTKDNFGVLDMDLNNMTHLYYAFMTPQPTERVFEFMRDLKPPGPYLQPGEGRLNGEFGGLPLFPPTGYDPNTPTGSLIAHDQEVFDSNDGFAGLRFLKESNPDLKIIISIFGWTLSFYMEQILSNDEWRRNFVESSVRIVVDNNLDGLDIDMEFPGPGKGYLSQLLQRAIEQGLNDEVVLLQGLNPGDINGTDQQNLIRLMSELREEMDLQSPNKHLELSAAVNIKPESIATYAGTEPYLDYLSLMNYDYTGHSWGGHHQSNLYHNPAFVNQSDQFNTHQSALNALSSTGFTHEKINLGFPTYARLYKATNINSQTPIINDHNSQGSLLPSWSKDYAVNGESGIVSYNDLMEQITNGNYIKYFDDVSKSPYAYSSTDQIIASWTDPCELGTYIKDNDFAGVIIWNGADSRGSDLLDRLRRCMNDDTEEPGDPTLTINPSSITFEIDESGSATITSDGNITYQLPSGISVSISGDVYTFTSNRLMNNELATFTATLNGETTVRTLSITVVPDSDTPTDGGDPPTLTINPSSITFEIDESGSVTVTSDGTITYELPSGISVSINDNVYTFTSNRLMNNELATFTTTLNGETTVRTLSITVVPDTTQPPPPPSNKLSIILVMLMLYGAHHINQLRGNKNDQVDGV
jgi:GH18 family chitinase